MLRTTQSATSLFNLESAKYMFIERKILDLLKVLHKVDFCKEELFCIYTLYNTPIESILCVAQFRDNGKRFFRQVNDLGHDVALVLENASGNVLLKSRNFIALARVFDHSEKIKGRLNLLCRDANTHLCYV